MSDYVVTVGPPNAPSLADRLSSLTQLVPPAGTTRVVIRLEEPTDFLLGHAFATLPSGVERVVIEGAGPRGTTALTALVAGVTSLVTLGAGVRVEWRNIKFVVLSSAGTAALFRLAAPEACLIFKNCTASGDTTEDLLPVFARVTGERCRVVADGLKVGQGFSRGIEVVGSLQTANSPVADIRRSGFRGHEQGVRLVNVSHARVRETMFQFCGTGLRIGFAPGVPPGGVHHVADCRFHDCARGLILDDRSGEDFANTQDSPADERSLECAEPGEASGPGIARRRVVRILRSEFRAPQAWQYPAAPPVGPTNPWGLRFGDTLGIRVEFAPHPASAWAGWPPQVLIQSNVFHLLDHGIAAVVGEEGQVRIDHNTFVAVSVRALALLDVDAGVGRDLGAVVTSNLFLGQVERRWLGTPEGRTPPTSPDPRYRFAGVEVPFAQWPSLSQRVWIGDNLFSDFGQGSPAVYTEGGLGGGPTVLTWWDSVSVVSPLGPVTWSNRYVVDATDAPVLRLPRVRSAQGGRVTLVEFDYHSKLGGPGAPLVVPESSSNATARRRAWLQAQTVAIGGPHRDYYGEEMDFHPQAAVIRGAGREKRTWQQWPLIGWAAGTAEYAALVDATSAGRGYAHVPEGNGLSEFEALNYSFAGGIDTETSTAITLTRTISGAEALGLAVVAPLPFISGGCPPEVPGCREAVGDTGLRVFVELEDGCEVELPVGGSDASFGGGEWSSEFAKYWLARAERYVQLITAWDVNNTIAMWYPADELFMGMSPPPRPSVAEFVARAREAIAEADPLRRSMALGQQSSNNPPSGGMLTMLGAQNLGFLASSLTIDTPSWAELPATVMPASRTDRVYRGSREGNLGPRLDSEGICLVQDGDPSVDGDAGPWGWGQDTDCYTDWGALLGIPLDQSGRPRWMTDHVQSSFNFARSVSPPEVHTVNRAYVHHHVRVLREDIELSEMLAERSMSPSPSARMAFHNPGLLNRLQFAAGAVDDPGAFRHDFWAGVHHASGVWLYSFSSLGTDEDARTLSQYDAYSEGLALIKGTNPEGLGLREALANGERAQGLTASAPGPHWLNGWQTQTGTSDVIDFGTGAGRTPPGPAAYSDLVWTAVRVGGDTWLVLTCSTRSSASLGFQFAGTVTKVTPSSPAVISSTGLSWTIDLSGFDAVVLRFSPLGGSA